ncbi:MAG: hypothetical protein AMR96_02775 [Candidatus Adiutrix intracellularis]|jgi:hypothetical protein|nr:MAG: hypothetical protein AMR96_02775 [Candidatus Adiutrix intracellularis]
MSIIGISLCCSYKKKIKKIIRTINFYSNSKKNKEVKKANSRLKTIGLILVHEIKQEILMTDLEK